MFQLPKSTIIKNKYIIQKIYRQGKSYTSYYLVLYVFKVHREEERKVAFTAGKKLGKAVVRNRLKRILRESYRLEKEHIAKKCRLFLVARKPMLKAKTALIQKELIYLLKKANIYQR